MVAEYSTIVEPTATAKISYLTTDYLGSPRINTDSNGNVTTRQDLHPYGEEIPSTLRSPGLGYVGDDVRRKFTVYPRDEELDLDYARLRMYANRLGRFLSVDPIAPDIFTPPSLNRYQYCLNNPGRFVDSSGGYDEEVHRDLTAALAFVVGFSEEQGNIIGAANQWLDDPRSGHTAMPLENGLGDLTGYYGRRDHHFTSVDRQNDLWSSFENEVSSGGDVFAALGTYLHARQDSFSHESFGPGLGQVYAAGDNVSLRHPLRSIQNRMAEMEKYDKTTYDPAKAVKMARDTLAKLLKARNLMERSGRFGAFRRPVPWETDKFINDKLWQWANTIGRDAKRDILFEIMRYVANYDSESSPKPSKRKKKTKTTVRVIEEE